LVELHGGSLQAESPGEGLGAQFTVTLPRVPTEAARGALAARPRSLAGLRVLLVEDEPDTRRALVRVLENAGAAVTAVASAAAARTALASMAGYERPQVLVSDIGLPGEDGNALLRGIRADAARTGESPIPAAAISAYSEDEARAKAQAAGFAHYLVKPITPEALVSVVLTLAPRE
jgi:CheY-like chemotaxis protein